MNLNYAYKLQEVGGTMTEVGVVTGTIKDDKMISTVLIGGTGRIGGRRVGGEMTAGTGLGMRVEIKGMRNQMVTRRRT